MSNRDLPESTVEWLSLVRYQMMMAAQQASLGRPLYAFALNSAQDAVESALSLVIQAVGGDVKARPDFLQSFDEAIKHGDDPDALKVFRPSLNAMNNARVSFKHHGNTPDEAAVKRHTARAVEFIEALTQQVFGTDIHEVSLLVFIKSEQARAMLEASQSAWNRGDQQEAMAEVRRAFDELVRDYTTRKQWHPGKSLFATKPTFYPSVFDLKAIGKVAEKMDEWLQNLDKWVKYSALGIDMRRYAYFDAHTPIVHRMLGGNDMVQFRDGIIITDDVYTRCFKFVVDTGIALAENDYDFDYWAARQTSSER